MVTLNEKIVKSSEIKDKIYYIWDNKIIGFGLKVIPNGKKKYVFRYQIAYGGRNAKQRWFLFGNSNIHSCVEARRIAIDLAKDVMAGKDPQAEKEDARKSETMADFWKIFDERYSCLKEKSKNYRRSNLSIWKNIIAPDLAHKRIKNITTNDIAKLHAKYFDKKYIACCIKTILAENINLHPNDIAIILKQKTSDYLSTTSQIFTQYSICVRNEDEKVCKNGLRFQDLMVDSFSKLIIYLLKSKLKIITITEQKELFSLLADILSLDIGRNNNIKKIHNKINEIHEIDFDNIQEWLSQILLILPKKKIRYKFYTNQKDFNAAIPICRLICCFILNSISTICSDKTISYL